MGSSKIFPIFTSKGNAGWISNDSPGTEIALAIWPKKEGDSNTGYNCTLTVGDEKYYGRIFKPQRDDQAYQVSANVTPDEDIPTWLKMASFFVNIKDSQGKELKQPYLGGTFHTVNEAGELRDISEQISSADGEEEVARLESKRDALGSKLYMLVNNGHEFVGLPKSRPVFSAEGNVDYRGKDDQGVPASLAVWPARGSYQSATFSLDGEKIHGSIYGPAKPGQPWRLNQRIQDGDTDKWVTRAEFFAHAPVGGKKAYISGRAYSLDEAKIRFGLIKQRDYTAANKLGRRLGLTPSFNPGFMGLSGH